jgi:hypothetical protein
MSSFTVHLKTTTGGEKISVDVTNEMTIAEVKAAVASKANIPADTQRLIYKGQVLKDDRTVESYGADSFAHSSLLLWMGNYSITTCHCILQAWPPITSFTW